LGSGATTKSVSVATSDQKILPACSTPVETMSSTGGRTETPVSPSLMPSANRLGNRTSTSEFFVSKSSGRSSNERSNGLLSPFSSATRAGNGV
jgi:hypothetical protein